MPVLRRRRLPILPILFAASVVWLSCAPPREQVTTHFVYPLQSEARLMNTVANPTGVYVVARGDTPKSIPARLGVDPDLFLLTNGLEADSKLEPGSLLIVPTVGPAAEPHAVRPRPAAAPRGRPPTALVDSSGLVRAVSGGVVTAVFRNYTSLGDVVIIESDREKAVYSGNFEPGVAVNATVRAGDVVATTAEPASVKVRFFPKGR
ncbi:MAG: LysM peptidoglycan-binding domain-containing protein [Planctomycetota bacterium]|jgi:hypothetical protein